jgi:hypothetical protein
MVNLAIRLLRDINEGVPIQGTEFTGVNLCTRENIQTCISNQLGLKFDEKVIYSACRHCGVCSVALGIACYLH